MNDATPIAANPANASFKRDYSLMLFEVAVSLSVLGRHAESIEKIPSLIVSDSTCEGAALQRHYYTPNSPPVSAADHPANAHGSGGWYGNGHLPGKPGIRGT